MSAQSYDNSARPEWSQESRDSEMPEDPRVTPEAPSRGPKVSAIITDTSVNCIPFSFTDLTYRYRTDWSAIGLDSPEQREARRALSTALLGVTKNRQEAKHECDRGRERWDLGWEAYQWVDTLVKVAELLSTRLGADLTVNDPQALKTRSRSELRLRARQSEDTPGEAQAAGAWVSADLIDQVLAGTFPHCPSEANTQEKAEEPRDEALRSSGAKQVCITTLDITHGTFTW